MCVCVCVCVCIYIYIYILYFYLLIKAWRLWGIILYQYFPPRSCYNTSNKVCLYRLERDDWILRTSSSNVSAWAWCCCWCMAPSCCGAHSSDRGHYCCVAVLCCFSCSAVELWHGTGIGRPDRLSSGESSLLVPDTGIGQRILLLKLLLRIFILVRYQVSAVVWLRPSIFWNALQHMLVVV